MKIWAKKRGIVSRLPRSFKYTIIYKTTIFLILPNLYSDSISRLSPISTLQIYVLFLKKQIFS